MSDRAAGMVTNPEGTERLHQYWVHGEGAAKIQWEAPGSFDRCVAELGKYIKDPKGYCNLAHHAATGKWYAQHGHHGRAAMDSNDSGTSGRAEPLAPFYRDFPLTDLSVRSGGRDGRIVTAYAAVFNTPAEIHDQDGDYFEEIDPSAFNRAISDAAPQGRRKAWRIGVFYNHGKTLAGTPSDRHSMPVGVPLDIKADGVGVLTETQYHRSDLCEEIVEGLESGAIPGYSFSGMFRRSTPVIPRGGVRRDRAGNYPTVRRMESTLREYGPTPFPAYADAGILNMRADQLLGAMASDPDMAMRMLAMFRGGAPVDSPPPSGAPHEGDSPAEDSHLLVRSGRSAKQEIQARRSAFLQRHRGDA
jgi:phage head maturation protease